MECPVVCVFGAFFIIELKSFTINDLPHKSENRPILKEVLRQKTYPY